MTLAPLALAALGAAGIHAGWGASTWLAVFGAIEAVHLVELPLALRAHARRDRRLGLAPPRRSWRRILATLTIGYPAWVPYARGVFD